MSRRIESRAQRSSARAGRVWAPLAAVVIAIAARSPAMAFVVINEIHYHPPSPGGTTGEFVELYNPTGVEIPLDGWRFVEGIEFEFPDGARIGPGGYVVVARDRLTFIQSFDLSGAGVHGNFLGALDNQGEEIVLVDEMGAVIDAVRWDDAPPWPRGAAGGGTSIQRRCATSPSHVPENWSGPPGQPLTPLGPSAAVQCPAPEPPVPDVVINEIHYHPALDNDEDEEFVELFNPGRRPVSVAGWSFANGISFTFPATPDSTIPAQGYLVVARNAAFIRERFGIENVVGDFLGELANGGERLALVDDRGVLVDVVEYGEDGDWPHYPDGLGRSLEKIVPTAPGIDPASWDGSFVGASSDFETITAEGRLGNLFTQVFVAGVDGIAEYLIDDIVLEPLDAPGVNLIENGDFEAGDRNWSFNGNCQRSRVENGIGVGGSAGLRLICDDRCIGRCNALNSVTTSFRTGQLDINASYRLTLSFRYVRGSTEIYTLLLGGGVEIDYVFGERSMTPGRRNSRALDAVPPFFTHRGRFPIEPTSDDGVWVSARLRQEAVAGLRRVRVAYSVNRVGNTVDMFDDGAHGDGFAGDGVFGVQLPPFPHNTQLLYRFEAETVDGVVARSPRSANPGDPGSEETWGVYINDRQDPSPLETYHVLLAGVDPRSPADINRALNCNRLQPAALAHRGEIYPEVGLRFRGNTGCFVEKRNLKFRFNRGRIFRGVRKLNLQGLWTDKSLLREHLAWNFVRETGLPACETEFIRVHLNGEYHGLFLYLEHPDRRFLERNRVDEAGFLYKARQPPRRPPGQPPPRGISRHPNLEGYAAAWEEESREDGDFSDIGSFIDRLHDDGLAGPSVEFMEANAKPEMVISYQISQVALNNIDSFAKNHFLYRDSRDDRWGLLTWDMDLVFGMFFEPDVVDPEDGRPVGTLNCCMLSPLFGLVPWFTTTVRGGLLLNYLPEFFFHAGEGYYRRAYLVRLWDVLQQKYNREAYDPQIDELVDLLRDEQRDDIERWGRFPCDPDFDSCISDDDMLTQVEIVRQQLELHSRFLVNDLLLHHPEIPDHDSMQITEVMYDAIGDSEDLEFVELLNTTGRNIDISGWRFTEGIRYTFPPRTRVGAGETILVVRSLDRFSAAYPDVVAVTRIFGEYAGRLANEGERLRLVDAGPGHPATIDLLDYGDSPPWPVVLDGFSIELTQTGPRRDNDRGQNWVAARVIGGTPGTIDRLFVRGDANGDWRVDLSDPLFLLNALFRGGPAIPCDDAADADDDGRVQINDALVLVTLLFISGGDPPPPFPDPGVDPTADRLGCAR